MNKFEADLHYYPTSDNSYTGMVTRGAGKLVGGIAGKLGIWGTAKEEKPVDIADEIIVKIYKISDDEMDKSKKERMEICSGSGRWLSHLILDGKVVWRIED